MKNILERSWMPFTGSAASLSAQGISDLTKVDLLAVPVHDASSLWYYFLIGVLGAIGGLAVKLAWIGLKKCCPKLNKIDNSH